MQVHRGAPMKKFLILLICVYNTGLAQQKIAIADFSSKSTFNVKSITGINWMRDGQFYSTLQDNKIVKYDITTGAQVEVLLDGKALTPQLQIDGYSITPDEKKVVFSTETRSIYRRSYVAEYYIFDFTTRQLKKLSPNGKQSYATISPDGTKVAFVRGNNLFYTILADMREIQVTIDGRFNSIINGSTDWVYEEEFAFVKAFLWSPDSKKLVYYRFDETDVKEYNMQVWGNSLYPQDYRFKYPKAGEANSKVEIWFYDLASRVKTKADLGSDADYYVPRMTWTQNVSLLSVRKLNRLQNKLELLHINATSGKSKLIIEEKNASYIDIKSLDGLVYLRDRDHFIWVSEAAGYIHLYLYTIEGTLVRQITKGNFEVSAFLGFDDRTKTLFYTSTEVSPLERHFYSISLRGDRKRQLTTQRGTHAINVSPDFKFYIDQYSSANLATQANLYEVKSNNHIKELENNRELMDIANTVGLAEKTFFKVKSGGEDSLLAYMLKPADFVAGKKYPALVYQYSGPGSQNVSDSWAGNHYYFHQLLTQHGYIVVVVDTRGTGARGEKFKKSTYKQLGKLELEDVIATAKHLSTLSYVDPARLGVWGWSYGGYVTALALTKGSGLFKVGIAVSPVTNWRFYDTIYTERYLQTPQANPAGYDDFSPLTHVENMQGNLLLVHGTGDDNVHVQNSLLFSQALVHAGKQFSEFFYTDKHHGIPGPKTRHHLYSMMLKYLQENL